MASPETMYARTARGCVAYKAFGVGERTIVLLATWASSIETAWDRSALLRRVEFYSSFGRVILLDHRGVGVSDPLPVGELGRLDEMAFDVIAVLDDVGTDCALIVADGAACYVAAQVAVSYPERVDRLILMNPKTKGSFAAPFETLDELRTRTFSNWGTPEWRPGPGTTMFPVDEDPVRSALYRRIAASPSVAAAMVEAIARTDVSDLLPAVTRPALVVFTGDLLHVSLEQTVEFASMLPNGTFVESRSSGFYYGPYSEEVAQFVTGERRVRGDRQVAAVAFTDVVGSTETAATVGDAEWRRTLAVLDGRVEQTVSRLGGEVVKQTGDGHVLVFSKPSAALEAVDALARDVRTLGLHLRCGVHFAEIERRPNGDIGGVGVHACARIAALAGADEVFVSRTVVEMTLGSEWAFTARGVHTLRGIPDEWPLFSLDR